MTHTDSYRFYVWITKNPTANNNSNIKSLNSPKKKWQHANIPTCISYIKKSQQTCFDSNHHKQAVCLLLFRCFSTRSLSRVSTHTHTQQLDNSTALNLQISFMNFCFERLIADFCYSRSLSMLLFLIRETNIKPDILPLYLFVGVRFQNTNYVIITLGASYSFTVLITASTHVVYERYY